MYIKQITIQGFKSYKNQTVIEPFSGRHNVIVGRNGSGKSNFFAAIRFVLSDAYTNMGREERESLLHEGSGEATMSAYVEIVFDNSDNRFLTGRDELILRRTIGLKKDEYSIDKKSATKNDVMTLLESAGFSRSNPYYIVPQGRITSLTNAKDNERLQLLKEVAGTRVYEQRRQESLKIIDETEVKRRNIDELLTFIEQRLGELEEEKEELKQFQEHDRRRRCLEYTIYSREQREINSALEEMEEEHMRDLDGSSRQQQDANEREAQMVSIERAIQEIQQQKEILASEKLQLEHELQTNVKDKALLELSIKDHEENDSHSLEGKRRNQEELARLEEEIQTMESELAQLIPEYQRQEQEERMKRAQLEEIEVQLQSLYSKQSRSSQFATKAQRDAWIQKEIREIEGSHVTQTSRNALIEQELAALNGKLVDTEREIQNIREKETARKALLAELEQQLSALKAERDDLTDTRKELWREDARMDTTLSSLREEYRKAEQSLGSSMDKNTSTGLAAVARIAKTHNLEGVYGPLYELFDVDDQFNVAVNAVAGASLFHIVCDNDATATRVLEELNKEKAGRVTFMPLNRLHPKENTYPEASDAIPLIKKLKYDPKYSKAFEQVFGKALVCRTLEIAATYSRNFNLNGITLDGDSVDRKGALTGGYQDTRNTRLNAVKSIKTFQAKFQQAQDRSQVVKQEIAALDHKITQLLNQIQVLDVRRKQVMGTRDTHAEDYRTLLREQSSLRDQIEAKQKAQRDLLSDLKTFEVQLETLRAELITEMVQSLTPQEHQTLERLAVQADGLKQQLVLAAGQRAQTGTRKNIVEITLDSNLRPRAEELRAKLEGNHLHSAADDLSKRQRDLATALRSIDALRMRIGDIDLELEELDKQVVERQSDLETLQTARLDETRQLQRLQKDAERYVSRRNLLLRKKEECTKSIRELGVLPEEAFEKYQKMDAQKLIKLLHRVHEEIKKYGHVNKKAFEQYANFTKQRDALHQRKDELDASEQAIRELIQTLDQRKDEAIERTFKQVAKKFTEVFAKLVPAGRGRLIMQRKFAQSPEAEDDDEDDETQEGNPHSAIDNYIGVSIQVSFNSKLDEGLRMQQLSGGQKSLVALTLIFAIQQCDPAPFYLFDEIDANLDAAHRTAVASMIHSLSEDAQFITTTFRQEMLANADKFYGVTFQNKVSVVECITKEEALDFVEQEQAH
ncbi:Structural maintenance of chromosomes protein 3 [Actinomortierella wolfii]|nr:Structural maintenance of chromosomes protein 3 [Actinomortierella wolfii]KAG0223878.1 Structural maintenance of chromosomes protein 3 [Actinomortierella wolfii]